MHPYRENEGTFQLEYSVNHFSDSKGSWSTERIIPLESKTLPEARDEARKIINTIIQRASVCNCRIKQVLAEFKL